MFLSVHDNYHSKSIRMFNDAFAVKTSGCFLYMVRYKNTRVFFIADRPSDKHPSVFIINIYIHLIVVMIEALV